jgi:two-component system OmpR family response regulator
MKFLIVEDAPEVVESMKLCLSIRWPEASVIAAAKGREGLRLMEQETPDVVILDVALPDGSGLDVLKEIRRFHSVPVLVVSVRSDEVSRVKGLELGADDYITKPFSHTELLARIKAVLRRASSLPPTRMPESGDSFRFGRWTLHVDRRELVDDTDVVTPLSSSEFLLLTVFLARPEIVLNRDQLLDLTRGRAAKVFDRSIDNQVSRLRRKIEDDPKNPKLIQTVWGGGYRFSTTVEKL